MGAAPPAGEVKKSRTEPGPHQLQGSSHQILHYLYCLPNRVSDFVYHTFYTDPDPGIFSNTDPASDPDPGKKKHILSKALKTFVGKIVSLN